MFLKELQLTNFRKFESLKVNFQKGLNVLVGENDSGKTTIVDAIRYILNTKSFENIRFEPRDFYKPTKVTDGDPQPKRAEIFTITAIFSDFKDQEAAKFIEWGYFCEEKEFELRLFLKAKLLDNDRITWDIKAGPLGAESQMDGDAKALLQVTYLKPLRDAEAEMTPGYRSRLAQILQSHDSFKKVTGVDGQYEKHELENIIENANTEISTFLSSVKTTTTNSSSIIESINSYIKNFRQIDDKREASVKIADPELHKILKTLGLELEENSSGLGTLNKLFMAAELLHLETDPFDTLQLCLIEELEAHLHPQAQLRVISALKDISGKNSNQFILTTHSTTIGASISLENLILCRGQNVYPMWQGQTELDIGDYKFLQRFLDSTKANMFFARGVIMVEGDAENILIPTIAELIGKPLHKYGVSIVNVGSTAFLRYSKIFQRKNLHEQNLPELDLPVSVITDLDIPAIEYFDSEQKDKPEYYQIKENVLTDTNESSHCLESIHNNIYTTLDDLKAAVKSAIGQTTMPKGLNTQIANWKIKLDANNIQDIRAAKSQTLKRKFDSQNIKVFTNKNWTLEYDLACSEELRDNFALAVQIAKKIKSSESYFNELFYENGKFQIPNEIYIEDVQAKTSEDIAYHIFKPFVDSASPSKAVTAQIFSEILELKKDNLVDILKHDSYLKYIIDAIDYACGKFNEEEQAND
ncbi:AAA family ATPase [Pseudoalteromonas sp. SR44-5]|uniref:ATP-dependent nuclease n=1 Tax=unclassified Pseudoalteromonas TaxID=194690 RepID=UPI0016036137|nr:MULTISPECIES: AAA family ATPase [unclassified Pseudoalteromonas]MBB1365291.1 AAA family ATPase [Pseudoalteromonas sp. SR44-5]MBB1416849.1 AAA family ATPase [Pseudoalteromonas sp. SG44-1]